MEATKIKQQQFIRKIYIKSIHIHYIGSEVMLTLVTTNVGTDRKGKMDTLAMDPNQRLEYQNLHLELANL